MMQRIAVVLMLAAAGCAAASRPVRTTSLDAFESFRVLDEQFTNLDTQYRDFQQIVAGSAPQQQARKAWRHKLREMQSSTTQIRRMSRRMYSRYRRPSRDLRYRMFAALEHRARVLNERLTALQQEPTRNAMRKNSPKMRRAMLDLVLQYQAISGGYAATNCGPGTWTCGVAKKEPRRVGYPPVGVKWTCVPRRNACQGMLGPQTPMLAPEPLTAGAMAH